MTLTFQQLISRWREQAAMYAKYSKTALIPHTEVIFNVRAEMCRNHARQLQAALKAFGKAKPGSAFDPKRDRAGMMSPMAKGMF